MSPILGQNLHIGPSTTLYLGQNSSVFIHGQTSIHSTGYIQGTNAILWFYDDVSNTDRIELDANSSLGIRGNSFVLQNQQNEVLQSIDVGSTGELIIPAGNTLHITSGVANSGTIELQADNVNGGRYAQFKVDGPYPPGNSGTISAYQYLPSTGWHLLSSPITAGFTNGTSLLDVTKLYGYDGAAWMNQGQNLTTPGSGYIGLVGTGGVLISAGTFGSQGAPNTSVNLNLSYLNNSASGGSGTGWNLVGNPFTCNLDFSAFKNSNSAISNAFYIWDPTAASGAGVYKYYASNAISGQYLSASATLSATIPPFQGFWVQASTSGQSISFSMANHGTVSNSTPLLKNTLDNLILTVQDVNDSNLQDALWLAHDPQQTRNFDLVGDAWKMTNGAGVPNIWSEHLSKRFAVNAFNLLDGSPVPIGFESSAVGSRFRIHLEQVTSGTTYGTIIEDLVTGLISDLAVSDLEFDYHEIIGPRFLLYPNQLLDFELSNLQPSPSVYFVNGALHFTEKPLEPQTVRIFSASGQLVTSYVSQAGEAHPIELAQGVYNALIQGSGNVTATKFFVVR